MNKELINIRVNEIHERDHFLCQHPDCKKRSEHAAHRVAKTKSNKTEIKERLRFLGLNISVEKIIHHPLNLVASCSKHNSYFNIGNRPIEKARLLTKIIKDLSE